MSELRIALVAEGPTDYEVIQAALKAVMPDPFVLTMLQPEPTQPAMGSGWGGVLKWCCAAGQRHGASLGSDPTLAGFDLLVIHLDADVARASYADCGAEAMRMATEKAWGRLPCAAPCPPASDTCANLSAVLASWLAPAVAGAKAVLCLPAQSTGTWLAAAALPVGHALLDGAECDSTLESRLPLLPLEHRIRKTAREYRAHAGRVTANWAHVKALCGQAATFELAVQAAL